MTELVVDFETRSRCDLKRAGAWRYAEDLSTEVLCLSYGDPPRTWYPGDPIPPEICDPEVILVAHNAGFEKAIWRNIMVSRHAWPAVPNSRWRCTMASCAMRALPNKLDAVLRVLRLPIQKDLDGSRLTLSLSRVNRKTNLLPEVSKDIFLRVGLYCERDVAAEQSLHRRVGPLTPGELQVWLLDQRINERGIGLDIPFVAQAQAIIDGASKPLLAEFTALTGGLRPTQRDKLIAWCVAEGFALSNLRKDTLAELLGDEEESDEQGWTDTDDDADQGAGVMDAFSPSERVRSALSIRRLLGSASIKKLTRMRDCVCSDGRARGLVQYHAAQTGRFGGRILQPHNFPTTHATVEGANGKQKAVSVDTLVQAIMTGDPEYVRAVIGEPVTAVIASLRHALRAADGCLFVAGDYSGIEARILLAISGQHDKAALMASGADVYSDMAASIYKRPINKYDDPIERDIGKHAVLGLGYGMGKDKFWYQYAPEQTPEFCDTVVKAYRKDWAPCVPKFWFGQEDAAARTVYDGRPRVSFGIEWRVEDQWLTARLPSGRRIWFFNPISVRRAMPWDATDIRLGWTFQTVKMGQWVVVNAHGGLLTGRIIQAMARDILVASMFKCERMGFPVCLTVHDEDVCEVPIVRADPKVLAQIMADTPRWVTELQIPIKAETWVGERYQK